MADQGVVQTVLPGSLKLLSVLQPHHVLRKPGSAQMTPTISLDNALQRCCFDPCPDVEVEKTRTILVHDEEESVLCSKGLVGLTVPV